MFFGSDLTGICVKRSLNTRKGCSTSGQEQASGPSTVSAYTSLLSVENAITDICAVADQYPSAEVIGVDLSPIQPGWSGSSFRATRTCTDCENRVPPNLRFIIDDVNQEWSFPSESFDFIHVRGLAGSVEHWPSFLQRCYEYGPLRLKYLDRSIP